MRRRLALFEQTQYDKIVYISYDSFVAENTDELFGLNTNGLTAGSEEMLVPIDLSVFVAIPSKSTVKRFQEANKTEEILAMRHAFFEKNEPHTYLGIVTLLH